jgi:hypothetical protein
MMTTSTRTVLFASAAVTLTALLAGCATAAPAATPEPAGPGSGTADPEARDPAIAAVSDYLDAIALGNIAGAWELLSAETRATYNDSAQTYADYAPDNGTVTAEGARALMSTDFVISAGPRDAFLLVSARSGDLADAWVVRDSGDGLRIDDPGIPPTGDRPFTWKNPDDAAFDTTSPPTIYFQTAHGSGGETDVAVAAPRSVVGYADGAEVPVTQNASAGSGVEFVADAPAATSALTVVWAPDPDSQLWQSSTVSLH